MAESKKCSRCGAELPPNAPGGHCPQCLLNFGLTPAEGFDEEHNGGGGVVPPKVSGGEKPGDRIGHYQLVWQIGEGGMGVVWLAEQQEPVRRRVALKIVKLGMDTKLVVARFEAERQALALMEHPNIAKVLEAGATGTGRPYFVMELVQGSKITDYCDQHQLTVLERLKLFVQVCRAVQHAHQKGIIHRDLKPSNILVMDQDGAAAPKVIDFGIAKATTGQPLTGKTLFTAFEQFLGTPAYMSPEQADIGRVVDIDTRSDIYSLGVLLYELLAGRPPFSAAELKRAALDKVLETIREKEPPRPSSRLTTLTAEELTAVAQHRRSEPGKLLHLIRGDLDWIVMKALEKDRTRRYETANGLACDVERHLDSEPVSARPPGKFYRLAKLVRRNRAAVTALLAIFVALILGLALSIWSLRREQEARRLSESALAMEAELRQKAEARTRIIQAELLTQSGDYDQAQTLLDKVSLDSIEPGARVAAACRALGLWQGSRKKWPKAAADFIKLQQADDWDDPQLSASNCLLEGLMLIASGQTNAYQEFQQASLIPFTNAITPAMMECLCRATLLLPADAQLLQRLNDGFYQPATHGLNTGHLGSEDASVCLALALVEYRRGDYAKAIELSHRCLACGNGSNLSNYFNNPSMGEDDSSGYSTGLESTGARIILAMAHHQLHEQGEAQVDLAYAFEAVNGSFPNTTNQLAMGNNSPAILLDWFGNFILWREATNLLGGPQFADISNAATAREQFRTTHARLAQRNPAAAQALLEQVPRRFIQLEGSHAAGLLFNTGYGEAVDGLWQQANSDWAMVIYGPDGTGSLRDGHMFSAMYPRYAPLLVVAGDLAGYEKLRRFTSAHLERFGDPDDAYPILFNCLLLPINDPADMQSFRKLGDTLVHVRSTANVWKVRTDLTLALLDCRLDNRAGMRKWLAATNDYTISPGMTALGQVIAALDYCQLGQIAPAQSQLALCRDPIENAFAQGKKIGARAGYDIWFDWWAYHILLNEARARIEIASKRPR